MISKNVKVEVALREEDRPIAFLVQMASQFESKILFETGNKQVNVKSMMGMIASSRVGTSLFCPMTK